jgi:hypothetical protein
MDAQPPPMTATLTGDVVIVPPEALAVSCELDVCGAN